MATHGRARTAVIDGRNVYAEIRSPCSLVFTYMKWSFMTEAVYFTNEKTRKKVLLMLDKNQ